MVLGRRVIVVGEPDVLEIQADGAGRTVRCGCGRGRARRFIDDADHPGERRPGGLHLVEEPHERTDRVEEPVEDECGRRDRTRRGLACPHEPEPGEEEQGQDDGLGAVIAAEGAGEEAEYADREVAGLGGGGVDAGELDLLGAVGAQRPRAGQPAQQSAGASADRGALARVQRRGPRQVPAQREPVHRQCGEPHEPQPPVDDGEAHRGHDDHQQGFDDERQHLGRTLAHLAGVIRDAGDEVAGAGPLDALGLE